MVPTSLDVPKKQLGKWSISPDWEGLNPHLATGDYSLQYFPTSTTLTSVPDCLSSGNPVLQALSLQGETFINQIAGDIYTYDYANKLFISSGDIDHEMAEDLQNQKWLKIMVLSLK